MMVRLVLYLAAATVLAALLSGEHVTPTALPVRFEPNVGQADAEVAFLARGPRQSILLNRKEAHIHLCGTGIDARMARLRVEWLNAREGPAPRASGVLESVSHYYLGADQSQWFQNVPNYGRVVFPEVYAGVDLVYYGNAGHNFPTTPNAMCPTFLGGDSDAFVSRIRTDNGSVDYATHFGGQGEESIFDLTAASEASPPGKATTAPPPPRPSIRPSAWLSIISRTSISPTATITAFASSIAAA